MVTVRKRTKRNQTFFYLEHSIRVDDKVQKKEKYLGKNLPKNIDNVKQEFFHELFRERWFQSLDSIKKNFSKEWKALPKEAQKKSVEHFAIKFTYDTNRIEGGTLSLRDTAHVLQEGIVPKNKPVSDVKEAEAHNKLFHTMREYKKDIDLHTTLHWHKILLQETKKEIAGKIRNHQVGVAGADVEFPFPAELETLLREFFAWYNNKKKKLHPAELAALVHLKFVSIHPFTDGNGRISRILMNFVLQNHGFPMLNIHYTNRAAYYTALERSQKTGKENIFVQYFIRRYVKEYKKYVK
jgi:Fic family protein